MRLKFVWGLIFVFVWVCIFFVILNKYINDLFVMSFWVYFVVLKEIVVFIGYEILCFGSL